MRRLSVSGVPRPASAFPRSLRVVLVLNSAMPGAIFAQNFSLIRGLEQVTSPDGMRRFHMTAGDRITFLVDGEVEAQSPSGELFGFDRTRAISTQSAEPIAAAARRFGHEDDIAALALAFTPAEVLHA